MLIHCITHSPEGLVDVIVYSTPDDTRKKNRGFAFLDYDSHKSASQAKRTIGGGRLTFWGAALYVEWAEPLDEPDDATMSKVREVLFCHQSCALHLVSFQRNNYHWNVYFSYSENSESCCE